VGGELSGEELLDGVEHGAGVTDLEQAVLAGQLDHLRPPDVLGVVADLRRVRKALAVHE
jgi:hypothetical protein